MTNNSGKFITNPPVTGYAQSMNTPDVSDQKYVAPDDPAAALIPECPQCPTCICSSMSDIKRLFGEYWWMWLAALIIILFSKE